MRILLMLCLAATLGGWAQAPRTPVTVVRFGRLWDGDRVIDNANVIIGNGVVERVESAGAPPAEGAETIDLLQYTGLPGLIDLHTHMTYVWDPEPGTGGPGRPVRQIRHTPEMTATLAAENLRRTLETGVTTVRDLGASNGTDYLLRDRVKSGDLRGPRMVVSGPGLSAGRGGPNPAAMRDAAEARIRAGADWVKVYGSRGSFQSVDTTQTVTLDEMKAVVDAAHALGRNVAIHSYGPSGVKDAVRAGADSVEHGVDLDDDTLKAMAAQRTVWVPTVDHNDYYIGAVNEYGWSPDVIPPLRDYVNRNLESVRRAFKAGVKIGMGSDAVYTMFGRNTRELEWFVKAGMTPAQALGTATTVPAALLGMSSTLGRVAPGYAADLVAVDGDPLRDIQALVTGVRWVMKDGVVVVDKRR